MEFKFDLEKLKKSFNKTATKVKEVSGNVIDVAKYKMKLSEIKSSIEGKYTQIGRLVYERKEENLNDMLEALCNEITELKENAEEIQQTIDDLLNKKACPFCSASVDKDYTFCPKCGKPFEEE